MSDNSRLRKGADEFGDYEEENTGRGWRKLRRWIDEKVFNVYAPKTKDYLTAIEASGVRLRLNDMSDRIEIAVGRPISDFDEAEIMGRLKDLGMPNAERMREAIKIAANRNRYHPVKEYLDSLKWDGCDHFAALMTKLQMSSPAAETFWRKFLIGVIAKATIGEQNYMLTLIGAQGKGKSRLVRWLCPLTKLFTEGPISPDNKDDHIKAMNFMLWEVSELDATTRKADRSALKHFISQQEITVRVPYGRYAIIKPAACSFVGTVNPDGTGFLSDPSGNRRFAVIQLDGIDWSYEQINRDQLWAQLYEAYKAGETWELTLHEREIQNQINTDHTAVSNLEEMLLRHYDLDSSDESNYESGMDILHHLEMQGLQGTQRTLLFELGSIMTKHGITKSQRRVGGKRIWAYVGVKMTAVKMNI